MDRSNVYWASHKQLQSKIKLDSAARCLTSVAVGYTLSTAHSSMAVFSAIAEETNACAAVS